MEEELKEIKTEQEPGAPEKSSAEPSAAVSEAVPAEPAAIPEGESAEPSAAVSEAVPAEPAAIPEGESVEPSAAAPEKASAKGSAEKPAEPPVKKQGQEPKKGFAERGLPGFFLNSKNAGALIVKILLMVAIIPYSWIFLCGLIFDQWLKLYSMTGFIFWSMVALAVLGIVLSVIAVLRFAKRNKKKEAA